MRNLDSAEFLINMKSIPEDETSEEYVPFWDNEYKKITEGVTINGFTTQEQIVGYPID